MKVERKEKAFEPVVITLESDEDLYALCRVIRNGLQADNPWADYRDSPESEVKDIYKTLLEFKD